MAVVVPKAWKWNVIIRFLSQQLFAAKCCFALLKSNRKSVSWKGEFIFTAENRLCKLMTSILMEKCTGVDAYSRLFIDFLLQNSICFKLSLKRNLHCVLKSQKKSHSAIKCDLSGNTVWPQALGFKKLAKMDHFWHFWLTFVKM